MPAAPWANLPAWSQQRGWRLAMLAVVGGGLLLAEYELPAFRERYSFALFFSYVVIAAGYGDTAESVGAIVVSVIARVWLVPLWQRQPLQPEDMVAQIIFVLCSGALVIIVQRARTARAIAQAAQRSAEAALQQRDEVLAAVSHDLKTPLTALQGRAEILTRQLQRGDQPSKENLLDSLTRIGNTATRMNRLLDALLDDARVQAGHALALEMQPTDLVALAQQAVAELHPSAPGRDVQVDATGPVLGIWDAVRLERVLGNLLTNAIKYSPAGGPITVRLRQEEPGWTVMEVQDHGVGIPSAELPMVFERFYQASNVAHAQGQGIGLDVVRQIVSGHNGRVDIRSQEGSGTIVTVRLPNLPPPEAPVS